MVCTHVAVISCSSYICSMHELILHAYACSIHIKSCYRIRGKFHWTKLSQFSRFFKKIVKVFPLIIIFAQSKMVLWAYVLPQKIWPSETFHVHSIL